MDRLPSESHLVSVTRFKKYFKYVREFVYDSEKGKGKIKQLEI